MTQALVIAEPFQFITDVKAGLLEILNAVPFEPSPPNVFDRIAEVEIHVPGYVNGLNPAWVTGVVRWVVHWVIHHLTIS
jgi:hypothetical protein